MTSKDSDQLNCSVLTVVALQPVAECIIDVSLCVDKVVKKVAQADWYDESLSHNHSEENRALQVRCNST